ncbi:hypothetical protein PROFUN_14719 [Planoprotostelium fungivorum]|uniref:Uncharacterized protein n=1 Tax=Planoprotostelium fungivorum TaxID=1890364 RepID=A0A2P6MZ59_9EUKA|nr:hypothetical protein PROFUN_14719 [Planoprotostelium fungivorum]
MRAHVLCVGFLITRYPLVYGHISSNRHHRMSQKSSKQMKQLLDAPGHHFSRNELLRGSAVRKLSSNHPDVDAEQRAFPLFCKHRIAYRSIHTRERSRESAGALRSWSTLGEPTTQKGSYVIHLSPSPEVEQLCNTADDLSVSCEPSSWPVRVAYERGPLWAKLTGTTAILSPSKGDKEASTPHGYTTGASWL